ESGPGRTPFKIESGSSASDGQGHPGNEDRLAEPDTEQPGHAGYREGESRRAEERPTQAPRRWCHCHSPGFLGVALTTHRARRRSRKRFAVETSSGLLECSENLARS